MIAPPPPTLRDSTTIGRFRVEVWQEQPGGFRVDVRELKGRDWIRVRGPFHYEELTRAIDFAHSLTEGLRARAETGAAVYRGDI